MAERTVFDQDQLLDSTGGDRELAGQVVALFMNDTPEQLRALEQALRDDDAKTAERLSHSIKGASATIGGMALREEAFKCEKLGHAGELTRLAEHLPELRRCYEEFCDALRDAGFAPS